jgi:hypothetical protein
MSVAELSRFDAPSTALPYNIQTGRYADKGVIELGATDRADSANSPGRWIEASTLPDVAAGQLWLVELPPGVEPSPLERRALTTANVLIYDRALVDTVAAILPLGAYAEPAASTNGVRDQPSDRSLRFVLDGWSVVRLIDATDVPLRQRVDQIRALSEQLLAAGLPAQLPILLLAGTDAGRIWQTEAQLGALDATIAQCDPEDRLTLVFGAVRSRSARSLAFASSNGLAG